ncbi:nucleotide-binding protein [Clostridiales bacterium PH28_bin88]|nr:nucleotide-binding protein [Clostridiales bacterium PH28_bin88]
MRVVIDTNVLISGMLSTGSYPARVLDGWVFGKFVPVVSPELIREYSVVLARKKFNLLGGIEERLEVLQKLLEFPWVLLIHPVEKIKAIVEDPKDDMVLECAAAGKASRIVTGDEHLLNLGVFRGIEIVTPKFFFEEIT